MEYLSKLEAFYGLPERELRRIADARELWRRANARNLQDLPVSVVLVEADPSIVQLLRTVCQLPDADVEALAATAEILKDGRR